MTNKPILNAAKGKKNDCIPVWFMRQAGRYLPEYRELRARKNGFLDMAYDPVAACEVTMQPIRRFNMDAAILFSDILVIPHALGQHLEFVAGEGPKLDALDKPSDCQNLGYERFDEILSPVYQTVRNVRQALKHEGFENTTLIGFAGSPWTIACYMIEGGGSRDFMKVRMAAYTDPQGFAMLIDLISEATTRYLINQIKAGAEVVQLFDSWASVLDAHEFRKWVIEPTKKIVSAIKKVYPDTPVIGFPRAAGLNALDYQRETGIDVIGIDSSVHPERVAALFQANTPVQGNLDPLCLLAGGAELDRHIDIILDHMGRKPMIFNLGHGIHKDTPINHVEQALDRIRSFKP
jgi:uroporphyrinogen decarboxylase